MRRRDLPFEWRRRDHRRGSWRYAVEGVEGLVDAATGPSPEQDPGDAFFTTAARNLQALGRPRRRERIVVVSIIGADACTGGYAGGEDRP